MSPSAPLARTPYDFQHWLDGPSRRRFCRPILRCDPENMGFNVLVYAGDIVDMPMGGLGTTEKRIKEKRDEVRRVLRALLHVAPFRQ